jgi:RNA polymerase sigma-70 factor, ECF subfamily
VTRDSDLLPLLARQDYNAVLDRLMERYGQKVMNLATSMVRDPQLAEDLTQTAFVKLWQALPRYDSRAALSTWLYTIARNTCLTELQRRGRFVSLDAAQVAAEEDDDIEPHHALTDETDHAARAAAEFDVETLLATLPEQYRRVVVLFYLQECSCDEVSELLGLPVGTVKALLHRGRKRLAAAANEITVRSV